MGYDFLSEPQFYSGGSNAPQTAGLHIGIVKTVSAATKSVTVLVPSINESDVIGPCRIVVPLTSGATVVMPAINTKVVVGFLDGSYDQMVCFGKLI
jgi:hypothetical protein